MQHSLIESRDCMSNKLLIWDLPLRIFHWSLVLTLGGLWYTSEQDNGYFEYHFLLGYIALGLVIFRLVWGFLGTKHSLFVNFVTSPSELKGYWQSNSKTYAGHNPAGSLMVVFMLITILAQAVSGLFLTDDIIFSGPYYGSVGDGLERIFNFVHRNGFDIILAAIVFHVVAVLYYEKIKKQTLVAAMVHGKKSAKLLSEGSGIKSSKLLLALILSVIVVAFVYWLVVINAPVVEEYYY